MNDDDAPYATSRRELLFTAALLIVWITAVLACLDRLVHGDAL